MPSLTPDQLIKLHTAARETGLEDYIQQLEQAVQSAIHCRPIQPPNGTLPVGTSRLGGVPDLPPGINWPTINAPPDLPPEVAAPNFYEDYVMVFVGQINLSELPVLADNPLPSRGILYFFYAGMAGEISFNFLADPHRVIYYDGDMTLLRPALQPPPERYLEDEDWQVYNPCQLEFSVGLTLPHDDEVFPDWTFESGLWRSYIELSEKLRGFPVRYDTDLSQILGYPLPYSNPFLGASRILDNSEYARIIEAYNNDPGNQNIELMKEQARTWRLLLQVGSHDETAMMWSDAGVLQFVIHADDLKQRDFTRTFVQIHSG